MDDYIHVQEVRQTESYPTGPSVESENTRIAVRETRLSRLLITYITSGLIFMLLPGTFLGVWNLLTISGRRAADSISPAWIQAHGHAQIFGWIGSFILGIGFYSIPKLRRLDPVRALGGLGMLALWTAGVALRWWAGVSQWHWQIGAPASAVLELAAFVVFLRCVSGHRPQKSANDARKKGLEEWAVVVITASMGLLLTLIVNLAATVVLALKGSTPALPAGFDQRFLVLETWGFLVPLVWGFSARWLPVFLGLRPVHGGRLLWALVFNFAGVIAALVGWMLAAVVFLMAAVLMA